MGENENNLKRQPDSNEDFSFIAQWVKSEAEKNIWSIKHSGITFPSVSAFFSLFFLSFFSSPIVDDIIMEQISGDEWHLIGICQEK